MLAGLAAVAAYGLWVGGIDPVPGGAANTLFGGMLAGFAAVAAYGLGCGGTLWYCGAYAFELFVGGMLGGGIDGGP